MCPHDLATKNHVYVQHELKTLLSTFKDLSQSAYPQSIAQSDLERPPLLPAQTII